MIIILWVPFFFFLVPRNDRNGLTAFTHQTWRMTILITVHIRSRIHMSYLHFCAVHYNLLEKHCDSTNCALLRCPLFTSTIFIFHVIPVQISMETSIAILDCRTPRVFSQFAPHLPILIYHPLWMELETDDVRWPHWVVGEHREDPVSPLLPVSFHMS